jgi:hypothetical protein
MTRIFGLSCAMIGIERRSRSIDIEKESLKRFFLFIVKKGSPNN